MEHYTEAIVLNRDSKNDLDASLSLYTKDLGRIIAKAKSIRRLTSKLSGHLTPGALIKVRIIEKNGNGHQIIDALSFYYKVDLEILRFLSFINSMTPLNEPDLHLWYEAKKILESGKINIEGYRRILKIIGYDPKNAQCDNCGSTKIAYFVPSDIMFLCSKCLSVSGINKDDIFSI